jgi:hypothetical protein
MKSLIALFLLLFVPSMWAQQVTEVVVKPLVSTATIDSVRLLLGSKSISTGAPTGNRFASVAVGQTVWGVGIPYGTTVTALPDTAVDSVLTLSKAATVTDSSGTTILGRTILNFSYYQAIPVQPGDFIGLPFTIDNSKGILTSVELVDSSDTMDSLDVILVDNPDSLVHTRDTIACVFTETDYAHILGIVKMRTVTDLGVLRVAQETNLSMPVAQPKIYGRLVSRKLVNATLTSTSCLLLRFRFTN